MQKPKLNALQASESISSIVRKTKLSLLI